MTTQEHLQKIKTKCQANLALAEKRTQGKWYLDDDRVYVAPHIKVASAISVNLTSKEDYDNAAFIAACAGSAEAGWRATIAAIDRLIAIPVEASNYGDTKLASDIIAAWPEELL